MDTTQQSPSPEELKPTEATPVVEASEPKNEAAESNSPTAPTISRKARWGNLLLDAALVAMTASLIGGSAWYLNQQLKAYHIPTALELAMEESNKLSEIQMNLEEKAFRADKNTRLKLRFKQLQDKLSQLDKEVAKKKEAVKTAQGQILAQQHKIRQADRDARSLARNQLIPGMMVGVIRTKNGQVYNGAIIRGIEGKKITVRHDSGQARFSLNLLETESLPAIVRYALGLDDLVDTSDFQYSEEAKPKAKKKEQPVAKSKGRIVTQSFANYDPKPGVPVLDSSRQIPASNSGDVPASNNINAWDAPDAPLPL